jgi:UDP-N-acetylglucosamine:LPS N-acetylglucosamine transferase
MLQEAFESLEAPGPKLLVFDRDDDSEFDRIMAASDLGITKGNRNIVLELAAMGVPALSVSHGLNVIDDLRTAALPNNRTVRYADLDAGILARLMREMIAAEIKPLRLRDGASGAAERLAALIP